MYLSKGIVMKKIKLDIVGLTYSQTQSGAYALVLGETAGNRRLPIIIGGFEAQAIAVEIEKMTPSRPLTHDLFKNFAESFNIVVKEVLIYNLIDGIFYAKIIVASADTSIELDARTSDAVSLAIRFNCPIYTYDFILSTAGIVIESNDLPFLEKLASSESIAEAPIEENPADSVNTGTSNFVSLSLEQLEEKLKNAIENEQYEIAAKVRDEIQSRKP